MLDVATLAVRVDSVDAVTAADRVDELAASAGRAEAATDGLATGATRMGAALSAAAVAGAAYLGAQALAAAQAAGRLESALQQTGTVAGFSRVELAALEVATRELSAGTVFSAEQIGAAFRDIAADAGSLADTPEKLRALTRAAVELATATGADLADAAGAITQLTRTFAAESGQAVDVLVALGATADEVAESLDALGAAGPVARALGVSLEEVAGAIQVLADAGIEGGEAGSGLALVLRQLEGEADQRLRPSVVGLTEALRAAAEAQYQFEGRSLAVGSELARNVGAISDATAALRESDAGAQAAAAAMDTYAGQAARLSAALSTLQTTIGSALLPTLADATSELANLVTVSQQIAALPPLFDAQDTANADAYATSVRQVDGSLAEASASMAKLGVGLQVLGQVLNIKLGDDISARMDEIFAAADRRTELLDRLAAQADGEPIASRGPSTRRAPRVTDVVPRPQVVTPEAPPAAPAAQPTRAAPAVDTLAAPRFLAQAEAAGADDLAQLRLRLDLELQAYAEQGSKLVALGELTEQQRYDAINAKWQDNEARVLQAQATAQAERQATLATLQADLEANEFEAQRQRLDARLVLLQDSLGREIDDRARAMQIVAELRARGYADIEAREAEAARRAREARAREWAERISTTAQGVAAVVGLVSGGSERAFAVQKVAAIATATVNAYEAASSAYAKASKYGPAAAALAATVAGAAQFAQVAAIRSVSIGGGGGGAVAAGGGGSYASAEGPLYRETPASGAPDLATLRESDRFLTEPPGALAIDEPTWTLPELTVNTPELTITAPALAAPASPEPASLRVAAPAAIPLAVPRLPSLAVPEARLSAPELPALTFAGRLEAPVPAQLPEVATPRTRGSGGVTVNVHNASGTAVTARSTRTEGPGGEQLIDIFLTAVAKDVADNGRVAQTIAARYGLSQQLGYRG